MGVGEAIGLRCNQAPFIKHSSMPMLPRSLLITIRVSGYSGSGTWPRYLPAGVAAAVVLFDTVMYAPHWPRWSARWLGLILICSAEAGAKWTFSLLKLTVGMCGHVRLGRRRRGCTVPISVHFWFLPCSAAWAPLMLTSVFFPVQQPSAANWFHAS